MNKITGRGKIILYAASGMGVNLLNTMMASYLCSALLTGGFGEAAIPYQTFEQTNLVIPGAFGLWAIMALIAKIIDGVIDVRCGDLLDVVEESVASTLARTINTTLTTLFTLVCLYIFGVSSIKEFAFPLLVGMLAGTYSSVLLSGQVWAMWDKKLAANKAKKA